MCKWWHLSDSLLLVSVTWKKAANKVHAWTFLCQAAVDMTRWHYQHWISKRTIDVVRFVCLFVIIIGCGGSRLVIGGQLIWLPDASTVKGTVLHRTKQFEGGSSKHKGEMWAEAGLKYLLHVNECLCLAERKFISACVIVWSQSKHQPHTWKVEC